MRKILKLLLIFYGVIVVAYVIYFIFGRPPIPLPAYRFTVFEGNQIHDFIKGTESDEVTITLVSNGEIKASTAETSLAKIGYTTKSLNNTVSLASKYVIPTDTLDTIQKIDKYCPCFRIFAKLVENFFYHILRFRFTFVFGVD